MCHTSTDIPLLHSVPKNLLFLSFVLHALENFNIKNFKFKTIKQLVEHIFHLFEQRY